MFKEDPTFDLNAVAHYPRPSPIDESQPIEFSDLLKRHKISDLEYIQIKSIVGRTPTLAELGVFSAMWSEHCSYKSSRIHLKRFPTTGDQVVVGPGENAGVVRLHRKLCLAFKMESHNHPSYLEPYQGAATGVGGILRDVFCMGARPIANLNCLRFGAKTHPRTPYLVERVVKGIGDYGNCVGIPTVGGSIAFDPSYNGNCLVNAMTVGLIDDDKIFKGYATGVGNLVVYVGSATGRDGIHGATMASDSFADTLSTSKDNTTKTDSKTTAKTTVQVGDPFAEKLLLEATLDVLREGLVVGIQDMGAAGLTSSSFEMAGRGGSGAYLNLDMVPVRAHGMTAYEILLSESQERMLMVVEPHRYENLKNVLQKWELPFAIIGVVTGTGRMQISAQGKMEIDVPVMPLTDKAPLYSKPMAPLPNRIATSKVIDDFETELKANQTLIQQTWLMSLQDTALKGQVYEQFDRHIGLRTVLTSDHGGAAVLWIRGSETADAPWLGVAMAAGCNERRVKNNHFMGAASAVLKCARQIWAAGGEPLAITDCLNFGSADDPVVMRELSDSVDGISQACRELNIPVVSGNVSLYNATSSVSIHPTPMIGMVGRVEDVRHATPAAVFHEPSVRESMDIFILESEAYSKNSLSWAASNFVKVHSIEPEVGKIGEIQWEEERRLGLLLAKLRHAGCLKAVRDVDQGGAATAAVKFALAPLQAGASLDLWSSDLKYLFAEGAGRYLLWVHTSKHEDLGILTRDQQLRITKLASVIFDGKKQVRGDFGQMAAGVILSHLEDGFIAR